MIALITVSPIACTVKLVSEGHPQCAVMPGNLISISIGFLIATCMSKPTPDDRADQWRFKYMSIRTLHS
jgi:hypothetical protein